MGITIHYQGSLGDPARLHPLIEELADIAASMRWTDTRVERDANNTEFEGLILQPGEDCEPLVFLFDRKHRLRSIADLITNQAEPDPRCSFTVSTKTQFTGIKTHIWIVHLLRHLKKHYLPDLRVSDEGDYWDSNDAATLAEKRRFLQGKIDQLATELEAVDKLPQDLDSLIAEIERILRRET